MKRMNKEIWALLMFSLVFGIIYNFSLWYAAGLKNVPSFVFSFEGQIPFLPWTIIPYLSSGFFFCAVFFLLKSKEDLSVFLKRVLFMTVVAGIGFVLMPLKNAYIKPDVTNPVFELLFGFLDGVDDPYNQSPSLHVAFAFAFWTVFRDLKSKWKPVIAVWLILVALSTLTTYQHHLIDIFTGSILAHLTFLIFPSSSPRLVLRNLHAANLYFLCGWGTVSAAVLLTEFHDAYWLNLIWLALLLFGVGYQYQKDRIAYMRRELIRIPVLKKFI